MALPKEISGQKYICLTTFRKSGAAVPTPVWFGEANDLLYVMTRTDLGKFKRIRNNQKVRVAPCTIRGKVTGPEFPASARILPQSDFVAARATINRKYWAARLPLIWRRTNAYLEISGP
jgi:PPOX class probable F420-dependent enzyme